MKPIFPIVRKDLFFLRWLLLVWLLLCLSNILLGLHYVVAPTRSFLDVYVEGFINAFRLVSGFICYLAVLFLFRQDPLIGADVAWVTRPISALQLFGAKLVSILCLCLFPALIGVPWWLYCGASVMSLLEHGLGVFLVAFAGCFLALPVALFMVRHREGSRRNMFLGGSVTVVGFFLLIMIVNQDSFGALDSNMKSSRGLLALALAAVFVALCTWSQFKTRNWKLTLALGLGGWCLVLLTMNSWSWNWRSLVPVESCPSGPLFTLRGYDLKRDASSVVGRLGFTFAQPFADKVCRIRFEEGTWKQCGLELPLSGNPAGTLNAQLELAAAQRLAAGKPLDLRSENLKDLFVLRSADSLRLSELQQRQASQAKEPQNAEIDATALLFVSEPRVLARMPLREGAELRAKDFSLSLERIETVGAQLRLRVRSFHTGSDRLFAIVHDPETGWTSTTDGRASRRDVYGVDTVLGDLLVPLQTWSEYQATGSSPAREVLVARKILERLELVLIVQENTVTYRTPIQGVVPQVTSIR